MCLGHLQPLFPSLTEETEQAGQSDSGVPSLVHSSPLFDVAEVVMMLPLGTAAVTGLHEVHKHLRVLFLFFLH